VLGDPDLDNPKFLFDAGSADETPTGGTTIPDGVPFASGEVTQMHDALAGEDDDTPPGKRAPTPLMGLDPEVSARQQELTRELEKPAPEPPRKTESIASSESPFDFGRNDDYEQTPVPGREPHLALRPEPAARAAVPTPPRELDLDPEPDTLMKLAEEEVDEAIARWDAPVATPAPAPRRVEVLRPSRAPAPAAAPARPQAQTAERPVAPREAEAAPVFPAEPAPAPFWLQTLVALVAIALIGTGVRSSLRQLIPPGPGPSAVQGLGWSAEQIRSRPARDAAGDPTLEVEGVLRGPLDALIPGVRVTVLDGAGRPIGNVSDARTGAPGVFLATLAEPPATAAAFRIELMAPDDPPPPPAETTTASPAPTPPPAEQPLSEPDSAPAAPQL
jgi:hypothetical protein